MTITLKVGDGVIQDIYRESFGLLLKLGTNLSWTVIN